MTSAENCATDSAGVATDSAGVVDTSGKFSIGVYDADGKLPLISTTPVAKNGNNVRLLTT